MVGGWVGGWLGRNAILKTVKAVSKRWPIAASNLKNSSVKLFYCKIQVFSSVNLFEWSVPCTATAVNKMSSSSISNNSFIGSSCLIRPLLIFQQPTFRFPVKTVWLWGIRSLTSLFYSYTFVFSSERDGTLKSFSWKGILLS